MTLIIVIMLIIGYLLIATGHLTGVNKAAIAMFIGTVGWVVYICWGADYVMSQHPSEYAEFLNGEAPSSDAVKYFIYDDVFLKYVGRAASIVMFLIATMTIIEILDNNGCFDFITEWIRTRNSKRLLWTITLATFILSANLDNLTTATMMLVIMHAIVRSRRQRMLIGAAIVLAANCGGSFTVIGDPTGLLLWGDGAVTATNFSAYLVLPALVAWVVPTILINRQLPDRLDTEWSAPPYRGDDTTIEQHPRTAHRTDSQPDHSRGDEHAQGTDVVPCAHSDLLAAPHVEERVAHAEQRRHQQHQHNGIDRNRQGCHHHCQREQQHRGEQHPVPSPHTVSPPTREGLGEEGEHVVGEEREDGLLAPEGGEVETADAQAIDHEVHGGTHDCQPHTTCRAAQRHAGSRTT